MWVHSTTSNSVYAVPFFPQGAAVNNVCHGEALYKVAILRNPDGVGNSKDSDRGVFGVDGGAASCHVMRGTFHNPSHNDSSLMLKAKAVVTFGLFTLTVAAHLERARGKSLKCINGAQR